MLVVSPTIRPEVVGSVQGSGFWCPTRVSGVRGPA